MKRIFVIVLAILMIFLSSCDFVKDRFLNGEPLYGGGHLKGTEWTPTPTPSHDGDIYSD